MGRVSNSAVGSEHEYFSCTESSNSCSDTENAFPSHQEPGWVAVARRVQSSIETGQASTTTVALSSAVFQRTTSTIRSFSEQSRCKRSSEQQRRLTASRPSFGSVSLYDALRLAAASKQSKGAQCFSPYGDSLSTVETSNAPSSSTFRERSSLESALFTARAAAAVATTTGAPHRNEVTHFSSSDDSQPLTDGALVETTLRLTKFQPSVNTLPPTATTPLRCNTPTIVDQQELSQRSKTPIGPNKRKKLPQRQPRVQKPSKVSSAKTWSFMEIERLLEATRRFSPSRPDYWELVASTVSPHGRRSGEDCAKKLIEVQEQKLAKKETRTKQKKKAPTQEELKERIPLKGNTKDWRMTQLIRSMGTRTSKPDLLRRQLETVASPNPSTVCDVRKKTDSPLAVEQHQRSGRTSIPLWMMTPSQVQMLGTLHTGLTPRDTRESVHRPNLPSHSSINEDEENEIAAAGDVLREIPERSLEEHRLIERHRKKAESICKAGKSKKTLCQKSSHRPLSFELTYPCGTTSPSAVCELDHAISRREAAQRGARRRENLETLRWTAGSDASDQEDALEELRGLTDDEENVSESSSHDVSAVFT